MDFWRISARKSRKEKVRNYNITGSMDGRKKVLQVIKYKRLRWFGQFQIAMENGKSEGLRIKGTTKER
jgi:hypothetical protein